jgi:hypothetical protein
MGFGSSSNRKLATPGNNQLAEKSSSRPRSNSNGLRTSQTGSILKPTPNNNSQASKWAKKSPIQFSNLTLQHEKPQAEDLISSHGRVHSKTPTVNHSTSNAKFNGGGMTCSKNSENLGSLKDTSTESFYNLDLSNVADGNNFSKRDLDLASKPKEFPIFDEDDLFSRLNKISQIEDFNAEEQTVNESFNYSNLNN